MIYSGVLEKADVEEPSQYILHQKVACQNKNPCIEVPIVKLPAMDMEKLQALHEMRKHKAGIHYSEVKHQRMKTE